MNCEKCGTEVKVVGKTTMSYEPVDKNLIARKKDVDIPFYCDLCGAIHFKYEAVRDVAFIYPLPKVEKIGSIFLPDAEYVGGNTQERMREPYAYVLSIGTECFHPQKHTVMNIDGVIRTGDKVYYEKSVPWNIELKGTDGKLHKVVYCGFLDILGVVE